MGRVAGLAMILLGALGLGASVVDWRQIEAFWGAENDRNAEVQNEENQNIEANDEASPTDNVLSSAGANAAETSRDSVDIDNTDLAEADPAELDSAIAGAADAAATETTPGSKASPTAIAAVNGANVKVFEQPDQGGEAKTLPWVDVAASNETVDEGNGFANFVVTLSEPADSPIIIIFSTVNDSAESDVDYQSQRGMVTFKPGIVSAEIQTPLVDDQDKEGDERFTIVLNGAPDVVNFRTHSHHQRQRLRWHGHLMVLGCSAWGGGMRPGFRAVVG